MAKVLEKLDFSKSSEAEHGMVEGSNLLDGDLLARGLVDGRASETRGTKRRLARKM
jgi:hypothetical protein